MDNGKEILDSKKEFCLLEVDEFLDKERIQYNITCSVNLQIQNLSDNVLGFKSNAGNGSIEIGETIQFWGYPDAPLHGIIQFDFSLITVVKVKVRSSVLTRK
jgi:hypothetical protein